MATRKKKMKPVIIVWTVIIVLFLLFPFFVMISTMLKSSDEVYATPPYWIPKRIALRNFIDLWTQYPFARYFLSSFIIAGGTTILTTIFCVPAAYAVARFRFTGQKLLLYMYLVVQMFSPIIVVISLFKIISRIGLLDTYLGLILVNTVFTLAFTTWMLSGYFKTIPVDIEEAAQVNNGVFGIYVSADDDDNTSTSYMVYLDEASNIDYGIYQNGNAPNVLGGTIAAVHGDHWALEDYHAGVVTDTGYVQVTINGTTYQLLARLPP